MTISELDDIKIICSWNINAVPWIKAILGNEIESWHELLNNNRFKDIKIYEPNNPKTMKPASIIFECFIK